MNKCKINKTSYYNFKKNRKVWRLNFYKFLGISSTISIVSWEVDENGAVGYEVGDKEIKKDSLHSIGTVISFEVKDIPNIHELMPAGWASSSGKLAVSSSDSTKATLTLGKADAHVSITLKKTGETYTIGDVGSGGGKVFYVSKEGFYVYDGKGGKELFHYLEMSKDTLGESK